MANMLVKVGNALVDPSEVTFIQSGCIGIRGQSEPVYLEAASNPRSQGFARRIRLTPEKIAGILGIEICENEPA